MSDNSLLRSGNLRVIFSVTLMAVMSVSSITPAFPKIIREFAISETQVGLLITVFTLPGVFLTPFLGVLADRWGRKKILVPSLFLFALAGGSCALAPTFNILLILRVVQGIGGAALGSLATTLVGDLWEGRERAAAMGLNASVLSIGTAAYPAVGGVLAAIAWNVPFLLPLMALPVGFIVLLGLDNPEPENVGSIRDYLTGAVGYLWDIRVVGLFAAGIILFIILFGTYLTYFTLLLDQEFGAPSQVIGLMMSVMSLTTALVSSQMGRINRRLSAGTIIKVSFLIYAVGLIGMPLASSLWTMAIPIMIFGVGQGANIPTIQTAVAGFAPLHYRGAFMSITSMIIRLGQTLGPPVMALVYIWGGLHATFYFGAGLAVAVAVVGFIAGRWVPSYLEPEPEWSS